MVSIVGFDLGFDLPNFTTTSIGVWITYGAIFVLVVAIAGVLLWMWWNNRIYNKIIIVFENISGSGWQNTGRDKARIVKVGDGGEEIMYLRKRKVYRTAYGRKMGLNTYWFAIGQDGYWYNVVLGDLDAKMGMLDIEPIDRDMRYMHVAIRKNIQERYKKIGFAEKYAGIIITFFFVLIMLIAIWLMLDKAGESIELATKVIQSAEPMIDTLREVAGNLDNICSGGSGLG